MLLPISSIKPAPDPIRKSWDEDKLNELAQSIADQGLIVPIKVRPHPELEACSAHGFEALSTGRDFDDIDEQGDCIECRDMCNAFWGQESLEREWFEYDEGEITPALPFEVVYGHRRLEAVRRNGETEIECLVEDMDDAGAIYQQIIENEQRDDVTLADKARGYERGVRAAGSQMALSRKTGIPQQTIADVLDLLKLPEDLQEYIESDPGHTSTKGRDKPLTPRHIIDAKSAGDTDDRYAVLRKAAREGLNTRQTRQVAQSIAAAPSTQAKEMLLNTEYSTALHDPEHIKSRAQTYGAHDPLYRTDNGKTQQKTWDNSPEVKMIIDGVINAAKSWTLLITEIRRMVQVGKMAPEGRQFTATKLRTLAQTLSSFADELEQESEREHA